MPRALASAQTVLSAFSNTIGYQPEAGLIPDGNVGVLGVTLQGGAFGLGNLFEVSPVSQLAFVPTPPSAQTGVTIGPSIQVTVKDAAGHVATNDTSYVTLSIDTVPTSG